jgi:hypothetical protein
MSRDIPQHDDATKTDDAYFAMTPVLLGNSFPLSLIRRPVNISPRSVAELQEAVKKRGLISFWGHTNTIPAARQLTGFDVTPAVDRPALTLSTEMLPGLAGCEHDEVWVLSPDYIPGFRPQIGQEVGAGKIAGWQVLLITFSS